MTDSSATGGQPHDQGPLSPAGVKALKFAVIAMAIMIVVGVAVVIGRILYLASTKSPTATVQQSRSQTVATSFAKDVSLVLPNGAVAGQITLDGPHLAVRYDSPAGAGVIVMDLATGKEVSRIRFKAQ